MIAPSILSADFASLKETLESWEQHKNVSLIHFDVMDNHFVPNLTFGPKFIKDLRPYTSIPFDVHLMVNEPLKSLPLYIEAGAQYLSFHVEALPSTTSIEDLRPFKGKTRLGLSVKPKTPISTLQPYLPILDFVLVMSVEPGFSGQKFLPVALDKILELDNYRQQNKLSFQIEVDGGVNLDNMFPLMKKGADILVMGSTFFESPNPNQILELYEQYRKQLSIK